MRLTNEDTEQILMTAIQTAQNKLARFLNGNKLMDKIPTYKIFKDLNLPTVNQINAQIKLKEVWKSQHSDSYPLKWVKRNEMSQERRTRGSQNDQILNEIMGSKILNSTFMSGADRVLNHSPEQLKMCNSIYSAKKSLWTMP